MYGPHTNDDLERTETGKIVGPKMRAALRYVKWNGPYASKNRLAQVVGPHGSADYGYRIVNRCIGSLLTVDSEHPDASPRGKGAVCLTDRGKQYLQNRDDK